MSNTPPRVNGKTWPKRRRQFLHAHVAIGAILAASGFLAGGVRADDVNITTGTNNGIDLDGSPGTTVQIAPGVTVTDTTFTTNCATFSSICATTQPWILTNNGTVGPASFGNGVDFTAGGSVVNLGDVSGGSVANGIWIVGGAGSVDNRAGATISGDVGGVVLSQFANPFTGSLTNAGTITSNASAVSLAGGGTVTNLTGGLIVGHGGNNAVSVSGGTSRTVTNDGTIQGNDSGFATGVALQNGTLTNDANGRILGAYNAVWANGASATSITNSGYIEADQAQGGGSAIEVDGGGTIVNSGTIRSFTSNATTTDAGISFAGAGSIANSGTIESTTGGLAIHFTGAGAHTLTLDTGSVLGGNVQGGTGTDNLVLAGTGSETLSRFLGFETLSMQGTGWSLTGTGAFSSADVQSGDLRVNGQLTAPTVTVQSGGTLGGSGTITGAVTAAGTVAPGNSIGTLTINGNYTQATGSSYSVELDNTGASDLLDVTGAATIQGGSSVNVLAAPGSYTVGTRSTILTAAGGVTGTYDTLTDNAPFVDFVLNYDADDVFLDVLRSGVPFASVARTPNERAAAGAVDSLDAGNPVFDAVTALDAPAARHAFDLLSGEIHPTISETLVERSADLRDAVNDRLLQPFDGESLQLAAAVPTLDLAAGDGADCTFICATGPDRRLATWGRALGNWGHVDGDGNAGAADSETAGFISGIDATFDESWRIGIAAGYSHTGLDVPSRTSSASIDSYHIAAYGGFRSGNLTARLGAAYSFDDIGATRDADFAGFSGSTQSEYWARTAQAFGEAGYAFGTGRFTIMPVAGLAYINLDTDGFHEGDGPMGLHAQASDQDALFSNLELRGATRIDAGSLALGLHGMVGWRHAFGDVTPDTRFTFDGGGTGFTVAGAPIARDAALLEAGADADLGDGITLSLSYSGQAAPDSWTNGVAGDVRFRF